MLFVSNAYAQSGASEPNMLFNFVLFGGLFLLYVPHYYSSSTKAHEKNITTWSPPQARVTK